jgi:hypothetical protein
MYFEYCRFMERKYKEWTFIGKGFFDNSEFESIKQKS